ncbi:oxidoreductase [Rhodococcus sp. 14-2686-1-2]|nr:MULTISPECIES: PDR/VanB family oxidoreductase [unclassified Rhodococcus (in: high G+C Gram-positive bacteria)]OZE93172.1 oxidoreductase [Rhodococcus sp. 15-1189-1-1a]OZF08290.1 oxidoreductase [Rhodococcus sp. 14-2686-1-2]
MASSAVSTGREMRVVARRELAEGVVGVTLSPVDGGPAPDWTAGAHVDLVLSDALTRQYSLCGDRGDTETLSVAVLRAPASRGGSKYVHGELVVGTCVDVVGPRNHFELVNADRYLFIAGGIGITPLIPMMQEAERRAIPWTLVYGGRSRSSMAFVADLVEHYGDKVFVRPEDETGLLDLTGAVRDADKGTAVYCCGPEPLLQAVEKVCEYADHVSLHVERFAPKTQPDAAPAAGTFEVELAKSGKTITVARGETILDAVLAAGVAADFSCREGTCGTCEVAVLAGRPAHRDSVLTPDEQAENDAMMICVSLSETPTLTLDI